MILFIAYYIFTALFMLGSEDGSGLNGLAQTICWLIVLIVFAPLLFPVFLGSLCQSFKTKIK